MNKKDVVKKENNIKVVNNNFVMIPVSAFEDERLSRTDLKVLGILYKFRVENEKNPNSSYVTVKMPRKTLKAEIGISNDGTYYDSIQKLIETNYIVKREEDIDKLTGRHNATTYTLWKADKNYNPYPTVKGGMKDSTYRNALQELGYDKKTIDENDVLVIDIGDKKDICFCIANVLHNFRFLMSGANVKKEDGEFTTIDNLFDGEYKPFLTFKNPVDNPIFENPVTSEQNISDIDNMKVEEKPKIEEKAAENKVTSIEEKRNENKDSDKPHELTLDERLLVNPYAACDIVEYKGIKLPTPNVYVNILYKLHNKPMPFRRFCEITNDILKYVGDLPITPKTEKKSTEKKSRLVPRTKPAQEQEYSPKVEECRKEFEEEDVPVLSEKVETLLKDWYKCGSYEIPLKGQGKNGNFAVARDRNVAIDVAKFIAGEVLVPNLNNPSVLQVLRDAQYISA